MKINTNIIHIFLKLLIYIYIYIYYIISYEKKNLLFKNVIDVKIYVKTF